MQATSPLRNFRVRLIGYCECDESQLVHRYLNGDPLELTALQGEYAIVLENDEETCIITSAYGMCQYYYTLFEGRFYHADSVLEVIRRSGRPWIWNWPAMGDFLSLNYLLGSDTLHREVVRVGPRSVVRFKDGTISVSSKNWADLHARRAATPAQSVETFNQSVARWATDNSVVSLSAGWDSRVILSSFLHMGFKPPVVTMGAADSTDVIVAKQIAQKFSLEHTVVALDVSQYLQHGTRIAAVTDGVKTAEHWHTFVYPYLAIRDTSTPMFIGALGDVWASTYYLDKGLVALYYHWFARQAGIQRFAREALHPVFRRDEAVRLAPALSTELGSEGCKRRRDRIVGLCYEDPLMGTNRFFLDHRCKNFHGHGLRLCNENASWRGPFLDRNWVADVMNLNVSWRLGHNWHRLALEKNCPHLLEFPEQGKRSGRTLRRASWRYWLRQERRIPIVPFADYPSWFAGSLISEFIVDNASILSEWIDRELVCDIVRQHQARRDRTSAVALLLTMVFWHMCLRELPKREHPE
jgi:asparagine synthetase B (glutamine-hydrolysing)